MEKNLQKLATATLYQAVRDYIVATKAQKAKIIKELHSDWMLFLTNDMSAVVADKLLKDPDGIKSRMGLN